MYGIMRIEKRKAGALHGIHKENNRSADMQLEFVRSDIDWERTSKNIRLIDSKNLLADVKKELKSCGIEKWRKDAVLVVDGLYTASPEFFQGMGEGRLYDFFMDCLEFHERTYGHTINAIIHLDENTPHLHVQSVPIVQKPDGKYKLCAKELMGGRGDYHKKQEAFYQQVGKRHGFDRGQVRDATHTREHLNTLEYKCKMAEDKIQTIEKKLGLIDKNIEMDRGWNTTKGWSRNHEISIDERDYTWDV